MSTLDLFQRMAQEEEQGELGLQTTQTQVEEKAAELREWFRMNVAGSFDKQLDALLRSGTISQEDFLKGHFIVGKAILTRLAEQYEVSKGLGWRKFYNQLLKAM